MKPKTIRCGGRVWELDESGVWVTLDEALAVWYYVKPIEWIWTDFGADGERGGFKTRKSAMLAAIRAAKGGRR